MKYAVECDPDFALVEHATRTAGRDILHGGNKVGVLKMLLHKQGVIGMVDEDPASAQPPVLLTFSTDVETSESGLKVLRSLSRTGAKVVVLRPRLEEWILAACLEARVNPAAYNLPTTGDALHAIINLKLQRYKEMLPALDTSLRMRRLKANLLGGDDSTPP